MAIKRAAVSKLVEEFSPSELWDHIEKPVKNWPCGDEISSENPPRGWNGNITWAQAKDFARHGWPEGLEKIAPVVARVDELVAHAVPGPVTSYDIIGDAPDIGAYLAGVPENMLTTEIQDGASRMVRILVNVGASAAVSPETIEARGVIACALTDALERVGYRVEVVAVWNNGTSGFRYDVRSVMKRAEEPLSLDRLAFVLIHPAFLRRVMFRCMELIPDRAMRDRFVTCSYGHAEPVLGVPGDVVISELYGTDWTVERMADEVGRYLKEVGVHMDGAGIEA